jgi:hypothetical protein
MKAKAYPKIAKTKSKFLNQRLLSGPYEFHQKYVKIAAKGKKK